MTYALEGICNLIADFIKCKYCDERIVTIACKTCKSDVCEACAIVCSICRHDYKDRSSGSGIYYPDMHNDFVPKLCPDCCSECAECSKPICGMHKDDLCFNCFKNSFFIDALEDVRNAFNEQMKIPQFIGADLPEMNAVEKYEFYSLFFESVDLEKFIAVDAIENRSLKRRRV